MTQRSAEKPAQAGPRHSLCGEGPDNAVPPLSKVAENVVRCPHGSRWCLLPGVTLAAVGLLAPPLPERRSDAAAKRSKCIMDSSNWHEQRVTIIRMSMACQLLSDGEKL